MNFSLIYWSWSNVTNGSISHLRSCPVSLGKGVYLFHLPPVFLKDSPGPRGEEGWLTVQQAHRSHGLSQGTLKNGKESQKHMHKGNRHKMALFQANPTRIAVLSGLALFPGLGTQRCRSLVLMVPFLLVAESPSSVALCAPEVWLCLPHPMFPAKRPTLWPRAM